jgi:hypothetical protein
LTEALTALVEGFADVGDACATQDVPLAADPGAAAEELVSLLEDVIYGLDVFALVPVRFHLEETEDGGIAGHMEVIPVAGTVPVGPAPKAFPTTNCQWCTGKAAGDVGSWSTCEDPRYSATNQGTAPGGRQLDPCSDARTSS